jgi:hypothetical protein
VRQARRPMPGSRAARGIRPPVTTHSRPRNGPPRGNVRSKCVLQRFAPSPSPCWRLSRPRWERHRGTGPGRSSRSIAPMRRDVRPAWRRQRPLCAERAVPRPRLRRTSVQVATAPRTRPRDRVIPACNDTGGRRRPHRAPHDPGPARCLPCDCRRRPRWDDSVLVRDGIEELPGPSSA